jgi:hypothetical protein
LHLDLSPPANTSAPELVLREIVAEVAAAHAESTRAYERAVARLESLSQLLEPPRGGHEGHEAIARQ